MSINSYFMKHLALSFLLIIALTTAATAQMNVGSNTAPDGSAMLQISGTTKGFLPPRMNRDSMYLIANPARGLIVFNTTDSMLYLHRDSGWVALSAGELQWLKSGNNIYNANSGNVGIGTTLPASLVHINGNNPLTITGLTAGTNTSADSLLTITNGLVRKIPVSTFGSGSVTSVSVANANGLTGTVADPTTTPNITLSTTITGIVKGDGTALSAAALSDYPTFNQNTTGNAANITGVLTPTSFPALTGDVTTTSGSLATTIANNAVTNAKLAAIGTQTFKGRTTAGTGTPEDLTATQATAMLNLFSPTLRGLVPASSGGTANFLRADGTFASPPGATNGTVTSVSVTAVNGVSGTVNNATTTPAISVTLGNITPTSIIASGDISSQGSLVVDRTGINNGAKSPGLLFGNANSGEAISSKRTAGGNQAGLDFYTNGLNRIAILQNGNIGIGTTLPTAALHINATANPLTLTGVQLGTNTPTDSVLIISGGVVRKLPNSTFTNPTNVISSLNGLTAGTQTFATSTTGTDFTITSSGSVHTFNMPDASATAKGLITTGAQTIAGSKTFSAAPTFSLSPMFSSLTAGSIPYIGNGGLITQNNARLFWDAGNSRLGIGTTMPTSLIHINGNDPLTITGLTTGTNTTSDSVLTISAGVVKKLPASTFSTSTTGWSTTGNAGTTGTNNFIGTNDAQDFVLKTNAAERMRVLANGRVGVGLSAPTAALHLKAGTATAGTAPLKLTAGTNLTTAEAGAVEFDGSNYYATSGTTRFTLAKTLTATAVLDFPSTNTNGFNTLTITLAGAADGDVVALGVPNAANSGASSYTAYVSGINTVTVKFSNYSGNAIDPPLATFRVSVLQY